MNKNEKKEIIESLKEKFNSYPNFYLVETESMTVKQFGELRRSCFEKGVEVRMAKNTLIKRAINELNDPKYTDIVPELKGVSVLFFSQNPKQPAIVISDSRLSSKSEKPLLKAALIDTDVFVGNDQLAALKSIKTKQELLGDLLSLLQSPATNLLGALKSNSSKLAGALKAIEEKAAN